MLDILVITGPIDLCIAVGYVTTRFGVFARADRQGRMDAFGRPGMSVR